MDDGHALKHQHVDNRVPTRDCTHVTLQKGSDENMYILDSVLWYKVCMGKNVWHYDCMRVCMGLLLRLCFLNGRKKHTQNDVCNNWSNQICLVQ